MQQASARPGGFNPQAVEHHYGLEQACFLASRLDPRTIHICTPDPEVAIAAVRRLRLVAPELLVESAAVADAVEARLGMRLQPVGDGEPDVALVPFARPHYPQPPRARALVLLGHNAFSYKGLLHPRTVPDTLPAQLRWMRPHYSVDKQVAMYGPRFLLLWSLALAFGPRVSPAYFWLGQRALDSIYTEGAFWWTGYITILCGHRP